jgi:hypothetical protein
MLTVSRVASGTIFVLAAVLMACPNRGEEFTYAIYRYNEAIRWGQKDALQWLPYDQRAELIKKMSAHRGLRISDAEIEGVQQQDKTHATVIVRYDWYYIAHETLESSTVVQEWAQNDNDHWELKHQQQSAGAPFPLLLASNESPKQ